MAIGNAVVGQSGGPTSVINQSLVGVVQEVQKSNHIDQLPQIVTARPKHISSSIDTLVLRNGRQRQHLLNLRFY